MCNKGSIRQLHISYNLKNLKNIEQEYFFWFGSLIDFFRPKPSDYQLAYNAIYPPKNDKIQKEELKSTDLLVPSAEAHKQMMTLISTLKQKDDMLYVVAMKVKKFIFTMKLLYYFIRRS